MVQEATIDTTDVSNLDECIETTRLTMECLAYQREIREIRKAREDASRENRKLQEEYERRIFDSFTYLKQRLYGTKSFEHYMNAAQIGHDVFPPLYVIQKEAEVMKIHRMLQLFRTYTNAMDSQYGEIRTYMIGIRDQQMNILKEKQQLLSCVRQQLCDFAGKNIQSYFYLQQGNNSQQRLQQRRLSLERIHQVSLNSSFNGSFSSLDQDTKRAKNNSSRPLLVAPAG